MPKPMHYCRHCGSAATVRIPKGDDRPRQVCDACGAIHYDNPRLIVGCIAEHGEQVLLCKRAIEPRAGLWTLPAGFMENGETTEEGAARETWEEARAKVANPQLYRLFDVPDISQVYLFYRGELQDGAFGVGPESADAKLFTEDEVPWDSIAFPVVRRALEDFFQDRARRNWPVRASAIRR